MFITAGVFFILSAIFFLSAHYQDVKYHRQSNCSVSRSEQYKLAIIGFNRLGKITAIITVVIFILATFGAARNDLPHEKPAVTNSSAQVSEEKPPSLLKINPALNVKWDAVIGEWESEITDPNFFSYVKDAYAAIEEDRFILTAVVGDATDPQVALELADTMIRRFNAIAMLQKNSIAPPSKDYYGGLYDQYGVMIGIAPFSQQDNTDKWFVYQFILPGMHTKQAPKLQKTYQ